MSTIGTASLTQYRPGVLGAGGGMSIFASNALINQVNVQIDKAEKAGDLSNKAAQSLKNEVVKFSRQKTRTALVNLLNDLKVENSVLATRIGKSLSRMVS